jgi:hypothetical protein
MNHGQYFLIMPSWGKKGLYPAFPKKNGIRCSLFLSGWNNKPDPIDLFFNGLNFGGTNIAGVKS